MQEYARCGSDVRARGHELNETLGLIRLPPIKFMKHSSMNETFVYDTEKQQFCLKFATRCSLHLSAVCPASTAKDLFCLLEEPPHYL